MKGESFYDNGHDPLYRHNIAIYGSTTEGNAITFNTVMFNDSKSQYDGHFMSFVGQGFAVINKVLSFVYYVVYDKSEKTISGNCMGLLNGTGSLTVVSQENNKFQLSLKTTMVADIVTQIL